MKIILCVMTVGTFLIFEVNSCERNCSNFVKNDWKRKFSNKPQGKGQIFGNLTIYLGYANNPFGPSKRLQHKNGKLNLTLNGNGLKLFPLNKIQFTSIDSNKINYGSNLQDSRSKRGVIHLYNMVSCATGCNPLIYKGYGCYCGFLGSGYTTDGIDRCCKMHDWCYDSTNCPKFLEYFVPYLWKCFRGRPLCALDHGEWGGAGSCAQRLCECDRALSQCLSKFPCPSSRALCVSSPWRLLQNALMIL